jgi:apolipoprotein N-acyltransferase
MNATTMIMIVRLEAIRMLLLCMAVCLFVCSHSPISLPLIPLVFGVGVFLWRDSRISIVCAVVESSIVGWFMARYTSDFFSGVAGIYGPTIHFICCSLYSLNWIVFAIAMRATTSWKLLPSAFLAALGFVISEQVNGQVFGLTWVATNVQLALSTTPIVQWSSTLSPTGVSILTVFLGCVIFPDFVYKVKERIRARLTSHCAAVVLLFLWFGGCLIERSVNVDPLPFNVAIVQPNSGNSAREYCGPIALEMSIETVRERPVDLIMWPEEAIPEQHRESLVRNYDVSHSNHHSLLCRIKTELIQACNTNLLAGVAVVDEVDSDNERVANCGWLFGSTGQSDCHEKIALMPVREYCPIWLHPIVQEILFSDVQIASQFDFGRNYHSLQFTGASGGQFSIAVAVCFESWIPWLPQYEKLKGVDAICHIASGRDFVKEPELYSRMLNTVRLRAIETRKWQLLCCQFRGSAIVDPRGRIVKQLGLESAVLRTD